MPAAPTPSPSSWATGTGSFGAKTDFATGTLPFAVALADLNRDGKLDLVVANAGANSVSVLLGTGTGSFGVKTDFPTGALPVAVAVADLNRDGKLDLVLVNRSANSVSVLLGTGTGSFGVKTDFATGNLPVAVAVGDLNGDGKPDLVAANHDADTVSVLLGTGTGSFGAKTDFATGAYPYALALADLDRDGKLDVAVTNQTANSVSVLLGTGTGSFGAKSDFATGSLPLALALADLNGDGKLDLAVANDGANTVSILLNTTILGASGAFGARTNFATGSYPLSVALADLNGDGKLDLVVTNYSANTVSVLLGTGTGSFGAKTDFATGTLPIAVAVADLNGDGKLDLVTANWSANTVSVLLGTGTGSFGAKTDFAGAHPTGVALADLNGDGKLDLVVTNGGADCVSVRLGTGTGSFGSQTDYAAGIAPTAVGLADLNGDGKLDLVVTNGGGVANLVSVFLGTGTGTFGSKTDFATGVYPNALALADLNGDGNQDLVVVNYNSSSVSVFLGTGTGSFGPRTDFATGGHPVALALADLNRDGHPDLVVANQYDSTVSVLLGTGIGTFGAKTDFPTGSNPHGVVVADLNTDGRLDLVVSNDSDNNASVLLNTAPASADLGVAMAKPVAVGGSVTYTVTVTNNGPNPAAGVTLLDVLPAGVTVDSITASLGTCSGATTLTCAIGALASGQSAIVTIVVTPAAAGILTSTVTVSGNVADSNPGNNTAIYTLATLTVSAAGAGAGTVTSSVGGIDCGSTCSAAYATNALVTLTPTPAPGSTFVGWSGDCTGTGPCIVAMTQPRSVTATFLWNPHSIGLFRPSDGTFYLDYNGNGRWDGCGTDQCLHIGMTGDISLVGDWNGSGSSKVGLFRPSDGVFYLDANGNGQWDGCGTDRCLRSVSTATFRSVGDWNGSGTSKVGLFRPSDGTFYLDYNGNGQWDGCGVDRCLHIGMLGDIPLVGDWNGSGTTKVGAFRPSDGTFYLDYNGSGTWEGCGTDRCLQIGIDGDIPVIGDWDGTWSSKVGVFRPSDGTSIWITTEAARGTAAGRSLSPNRDERRHAPRRRLSGTARRSESSDQPTVRSTLITTATGSGTAVAPTTVSKSACSATSRSSATGMAVGQQGRRLPPVRRHLLPRLQREWDLGRLWRRSLSPDRHARRHPARRRLERHRHEQGRRLPPE